MQKRRRFLICWWPRRRQFWHKSWPLGLLKCYWTDEIFIWLHFAKNQRLKEPKLRLRDHFEGIEVVAEVGLCQKQLLTKFQIPSNFRQKWFVKMISLSLRRGWARTQTPTTRNCTVELPTFAVIAGVSPIWVQWKSLTLEESPLWSELLPRQVSMLLLSHSASRTLAAYSTLVDGQPSTSYYYILGPAEGHKIGSGCPWIHFILGPSNLSLLGLMAKIKCSICSYQFNIWYAGHSLAHILIWFLAFGQGSEACLTLTTGCLGIALQPSAAHFHTQWNPSSITSSNIPMFLLRISITLTILLCLKFHGISYLKGRWCAKCALEGRRSIAYNV